MGLRADIRDLRRQLRELPVDETLRARTRAAALEVVGRTIAGLAAVVGGMFVAGVAFQLVRGRVPPGRQLLWQLLFCVGPLAIAAGLDYVTKRAVRARLRRALQEAQSAPSLTTAIGGGGSSAAVSLRGR